MTSTPTDAPAQPAAPAMTGGAAILARLRAQRAAGTAAAPAAPRPPRAVFLFASQTGTGAEIARNLAAEAASHGVAAEAASMNELGWANFSPERTPLAVFVASSTGDGDPPDNSAAFYVQLKKPQPPGRLAGVRFAVLGLGDSNYTRFMHVPRVIRSRMLELGAAEFYPSVEADEVDGLEDKVDPWCEGIWGPLKAAMAGAAPSVTKAAPAAAAAAPAAVPAAAPAAAATAAPAAAAAAPAGLVDGIAPEGVDLSGAPALAPPRVELRFLPHGAAGAAAALAREAARPGAAELAVRDEAGTYSAAAPYWASVAGARLLTAPGSDRVVVHAELDVGGSGMAYTPGDSIGVLPERLGLEGDAVFEVGPAAGAGAPAAALLPHLAPPCSLRAAFRRGLDVTGVPRKSLLRTLAEHCGNEAEKRTLLFLTSRAGRDAYAREMVAAQPTLLDLLNRFPSCAPPPAALLDALPPLVPRMYSICCAPGAVAQAPGGGPARVEFAFSLVTVPTPSGTRRGVATGWLHRLLAPWLDGGDGSSGGGGAPARVAVFLRPSDSFGPPRDVATPIIMVGPGTGVAPFRGFLQQRAADAAAAADAAGANAGGAPAGEAALYFGCRRPGEDYLYRSDLEGFAADGTLSRLRVAFSRLQPGDGAAAADGPAAAAAAGGGGAAAGGAAQNGAAAAGAGVAGKTYVQHLMAEDGAAIAEAVLSRGARVYVCGDGAAMARDVHAALAAALAGHGGLGAAGAEARLKAMAAEGAYVRDVWCA
ncbi:methionine synthase reductase [Raphidocelis subcapitata]|uniref:Methionine synthase reductase n=1 Tax=Raphidocelis subcapitata TaxID=307507 RepID=A0A2V0NX09_9CHLO|nr:methionine synthase reductase [Raphidocelis subcapitata]|eukprot:GBF92178.1 methionine synthase reductase [Raphidocelis subcapitata]